MQEINEKSNEQGKVSEKPKDKIAFRSLTQTRRFIPDDMQSTLYNPSRAEVRQWGEETDLFILKIGGPDYDARITVGLSTEQLKQLGQIITEALTWADIPKNTKVI